MVCVGAGVEEEATARGWRRRGACKRGARVFCFPPLPSARAVSPHTPQLPHPPACVCHVPPRQRHGEWKRRRKLGEATKRTAGRENKRHVSVCLTRFTPLFSFRRRPLLSLPRPNPLANHALRRHRQARRGPDHHLPQGARPRGRRPPGPALARRDGCVVCFFVFGVESAVGVQFGRCAPRSSPTPAQGVGRLRLGGAIGRLLGGWRTPRVAKTPLAINPATPPPALLSPPRAPAAARLPSRRPPRRLLIRSQLCGGVGRRAASAFVRTAWGTASAGRLDPLRCSRAVSTRETGRSHRALASHTQTTHPTLKTLTLLSHPTHTRTQKHQPSPSPPRARRPPSRFPPRRPPGPPCAGGPSRRRRRAPRE